MTQISLHRAAQRKKKIAAHLQEQLGSLEAPYPRAFSISEQDTTMSSETQPSEASTFWHHEMCILLPTGSTRCQALTSWILTVIPND